ncbi:unnamed protein product [Leptosia nina]|uniref:Uncharacterized protein n=1 Tax=Leptosia nina TaxID=320188 RepID=A0AAV1JTE3_9NEOP
MPSCLIRKQTLFILSLYSLDGHLICRSNESLTENVERTYRLSVDEVNNATARVQTKKPPAVPNVCVQWPEGLRVSGVTWPWLGAAPAATPAPPLVLAPRAAQRRR